MTCLVTLWLIRKVFLDALELYVFSVINLSAIPCDIFLRPPPQLRVLRDPEHDEVGSETE